MQTRKEYAVGLGLAKPGRGRLSKEAWEAIHAAEADGMQFADKKPPTVTQSNIVNVKPEPRVKVRDIGEKLVGYTVEGWAVGFDNCRRCHKHANYCTCRDGILAPSIVVRVDSPDVKVAND